MKAFLDAIQYQASFEKDPTWSEHGMLSVARCAEPCDWHWPRDFHFREEFYVVDADPAAVIDAVRSYGPLDRNAHLINAFCAADECIKKGYEQLGYQHCFTKRLLGKSLGDDAIVIDDHNVIQFDSVDDADFGEIDESERPVNWTVVADEAVRHYSVCEGGKAVSWGMLVTNDPSITYVGQMFTLSAFRQKGCGAALLSYMHAEAKRLSCNTMILMPSYETVDWYPKFGYRPVADCAIFCPQL